MPDVMTQSPDAGTTVQDAAPAQAAQAAPTVEPAAGNAEGTAPENTQAASGAPELFDRADFQKMRDALPPEMQAHADLLDKTLTGNYYKKTQALAEQNRAGADKIKAYDDFNRDPVTAMQQIAKNHGYSLSRAEAAAQVDAAGPADEWQPQTWDEVMVKATERAKAELMQEFGPMIESVRGLKTQSLEAQLDGADPAWRDHEDTMKATLQLYPKMANDIPRLLQNSLPPALLEGRAMKAALAKLEGRTAAATVARPTTARATQAATGNLTFQESVDAARKSLAAG